MLLGRTIDTFLALSSGDSSDADHRRHPSPSAATPWRAALLVLLGLAAGAATSSAAQEAGTTQTKRGRAVAAPTTEEPASQVPRPSKARAKAQNGAPQKSKLPPQNRDEQQVPPFTVPDVLARFDGSRVGTAADWRALRRPEIIEAFRAHVYGRTPDLPTQPRVTLVETDAKALDGLATRKQVTIALFPEPDAPRIDLLLYVPNGARRPAPAFLSLNYGNQSVHADPAIVPSRNTTPLRGEIAARWPLELILRRGYALATFAGADVEQDPHGSGTTRRPDGWREGVRGYALRKAGLEDRTEDAWGSIAAWAWGLSRALDYLESEPSIDARKVAVIGHSRTAKAALWAAAQDERFALAVSNNSGAGGAALARRIFGEAVIHSKEIWYCKNYRRFAHNESALPVDQHMLLALLAPRPVYVASATEDHEADPRGEFLSALHAGPVYALYGLRGLGVETMPPPETPIGDSIGYHLRTGKHEITPYDWERYLDFADRHFAK